MTGLDDSIGGRKVTPRAMLETLAGTADALRLPHPVHIHCNNLGDPRKRRDDAREHAGAVGPARALHASPVSLLRWRAGKGVEVGRARDHRVRQRPPRGEHRRGPGDVRAGDDGHRRRSGRISAPQEQRTKWINIDIELETGCGIVPLAYKDKAAVASLQWAIGLELFLLSADPVARRALDRSSERRLVSLVSGAHPAPDGSSLSRRRTAQAGQSEAARGQRAGRRARARVHAERDRDHHPRGPGAAARARAQGSPRRGRRCGRHRLHPRVRHREDVLDAAIRDQGRHADRRGGSAPPSARGAENSDFAGLRRRVAARPAPALRVVLLGVVRQLSRQNLPDEPVAVG